MAGGYCAHLVLRQGLLAHANGSGHIGADHRHHLATEQQARPWKGIATGPGSSPDTDGIHRSLTQDEFLRGKERLRRAVRRAEDTANTETRSNWLDLLVLR